MVQYNFIMEKTILLHAFKQQSDAGGPINYFTPIITLSVDNITMPILYLIDAVIITSPSTSLHQNTLLITQSLQTQFLNAFTGLTMILSNIQLNLTGTALSQVNTSPFPSYGTWSMTNSIFTILSNTTSFTLTQVSGQYQQFLCMSGSCIMNNNVYLNLVPILPLYQLLLNGNIIKLEFVLHY